MDYDTNYMSNQLVWSEYDLHKRQKQNLLNRHCLRRKKNQFPKAVLLDTQMHGLNSQVGADNYCILLYSY